jgi:hypothetical protein
MRIKVSDSVRKMADISSCKIEIITEFFEYFSTKMG